MAWKHRKLLMSLATGRRPPSPAARPGRLVSPLARRAREPAAAGVEVACAEADRVPRVATCSPTAASTPSSGGSTWQSLARGPGSARPTTSRGEIALLGRLHDVPTPVNEAVVAATRSLAYAGAAPRSLDAAEVLRAL